MMLSMYPVKTMQSLTWSLPRKFTLEFYLSNVLVKLVGNFQSIKLNVTKEGLKDLTYIDTEKEKKITAR